MTEAEWLTATDPQPMLEFLRGKVSDRKLRLFAVAACRHSLLCFGHYDLDVIVDAAEQVADEIVVDLETETIRGTVDWATTEMCESLNYLGASVRDMIAPAAFTVADAVRIATWIQEAHSVASVASSSADEVRQQSTLLRDIFGNPFRSVAFDPAWRSESVLALASGIYADRAFDRLPVLADALEEAGCDHPDMLNHCRGPGPHVRGCWVVDLVLGKE